MHRPGSSTSRFKAARIAKNKAESLAPSHVGDVEYGALGDVGFGGCVA
jgi:hypothetical protein